MRNFARFALAVAFLFVLGVSVVGARSFHQQADDLTIGAQLYDKWYAVLGVPAPDGNMPIWERQTTNTRSGADTWRCSECHGWDYKGSEGAYASGSHYTGFPNVMKLAQTMTLDEIVAHLKGAKDPSHDFSKYIDDQNLERLAKFVKEGVMDDAIYVDPVTLNVQGANVENGKNRYNQTCAACHGPDGKAIVFRTEGVDEYLGTVANRDPYRFLHRTRFGVAGTEMPVGVALGWMPADGRDVLAYAQTLPTGADVQVAADAGAGSEASPIVGGPGQGWGGGILAGLLAFLGTFGLSLFFLGGMVLAAAIVVFVLRRRK